MPFSKRRRRSQKKLPSLNFEDISAPLDAKWDEEWTSATMTRNYLLNDPLCDWLKYNYSSLLISQPRLTKDVFSTIRKPHFSFTDYIMKQGVKFEEKVIDLIIEKYGDMLIRIGGELCARSPKKVQETLDAMNKGIPFIHSGVLHNPENKTYGIPDLLVRSDWINNLVTIKPVGRKEKYIPARRLRDPLHPENYPSYHYLVVDIKFSTLPIRVDGVNILNSGSFPAYKSQLLIYNQALARIQGYDPNKAFILGRKWKIMIAGNRYEGNSCFDRLGVIDYSSVDLKYVDKTEKALHWLREVRSEEAETWDISHPPFIRPELYPNMSNHSDSPWRSIKEKIAKNIYELTSLWMVGVKHRQIAHSNEIWGWNDERCIPENIGINGKFTSRILDEILKINQPSNNIKISPPIIKNNYGNWQQPQTIEFYVDFENVSNVLTKFDTLPYVEDGTIIFMIGVGHINPCTSQWVHRSFIVNLLNQSEEKEMCKKFVEYIRSEAALYNVSDPLCFHWAPAEEKMWEKVMKKYGVGNIHWLDLLKVFKEEPIVIRGALNFSLKTIVRAMTQNGFIDVEWTGGCLDGQGAMLGAYEANRKAKKSKTSMRETPEIKAIDEYNRIDVKALYEIVNYLRIHHRDENIKRKRSSQPLRRSKRLRNK